jgi:hypothetical protein
MAEFFKHRGTENTEAEKTEEFQKESPRPPRSLRFILLVLVQRPASTEMNSVGIVLSDFGSTIVIGLVVS